MAENNQAPQDLKTWLQKGIEDFYNLPGMRQGSELAASTQKYFDELSQAIGANVTAPPPDPKDIDWGSLTQLNRQAVARHVDNLKKMLGNWHDQLNSIISNPRAALSAASVAVPAALIGAIILKGGEEGGVDFPTSLEKGSAGSLADYLNERKGVTFKDYRAVMAGQPLEPEVAAQVQDLAERYSSDPNFKKLADSARHYVHNATPILDASRELLGLRPVYGLNSFINDKNVDLLDGSLDYTDVADSKQHAANLMQAIREASPTSNTLYRGISVIPPEYDQYWSKLKPGDTISKPLSSFTDNPNVIPSYMESGGLKKPIQFVLEGPHKSIQISPFNHYGEGEHLTHGEFEVTKVEPEAYPWLEDYQTPSKKKVATVYQAEPPNDDGLHVKIGKNDYYFNPETGNIDLNGKETGEDGGNYRDFFKKHQVSHVKGLLLDGFYSTPEALPIKDYLNAAPVDWEEGDKPLLTPLTFYLKQKNTF